MSVILKKALSVLKSIWQQRMEPTKVNPEETCHLGEVLNTAPCGFLSFTDDGRIVTVNATLLKWLGYELEELRGQCLEVILSVSSRIFYQTHFFPLLKMNGTVEEIYLSIKPKQGEPLPILLNAVRQERWGLVVNDCVLVMMRQRIWHEEKLREATEKADAASRAKSEFLASMSHELRTPLNAILGFAQLMIRDRTLSPEHRKNLEIVTRSGEHLLTMINDILEMSKIEAGRTSLVPTTFDLHRFLDNLGAMLQLSAHAKGLQLMIDRPLMLPQYISTDEGKLRQVIINLLSNAIKFTQNGWVMLRVRFVPEIYCSDGKLSSGQLDFEVEDTGPGIAPEEMDRLFEPFEQTRTGLNSGQGTGLGLPISRKFVQLMGGDIQVSSQVGQGSLFRFSVRVKLEETASSPQATSTQLTVLSDHQLAYRFLVVDDNESNRLLLVKFLTACGFEVQEATTGQEAWERWQTWQPNVIFMDMQMPVMDGCEATRRIRQLEAQKAQGSSATCIIATTASVSVAQRQKTLEAGCNDFISKPFQWDELIEMISKHLQIAVCKAVPGVDSMDTPVETTVLPPPLDVTTLATLMPSDWIAQLHLAASQGNDNTSLKLIAQIPSEHASLIAVLTDLVEQYQFEKLVALIKPSGESV